MVTRLPDSLMVKDLERSSENLKRVEKRDV
jgi:hypothetical protein